MAETTYVYRPVNQAENVGDPMHNELWVPAEQLAEFNAHIRGPIEVTAEFGRP